jgi:hypothetical protein
MPVGQLHFVLKELLYSMISFPVAKPPGRFVDAIFSANAMPTLSQAQV